MLYVRKKKHIMGCRLSKTKIPFEKKKIYLQIQTHKYNLLKYTNTFWNAPQIQFEFRRKMEKKIKNFEKKWTIWTWLITVELIKNY